MMQGREEVRPEKKGFEKQDSGKICDCVKLRSEQAQTGSWPPRHHEMLHAVSTSISFGHIILCKSSWRHDGNFWKAKKLRLTNNSICRISKEQNWALELLFCSFHTKNGLIRGTYSVHTKYMCGDKNRFYCASCS